MSSLKSQPCSSCHQPVPVDRLADTAVCGCCAQRWGEFFTATYGEKPKTGVKGRPKHPAVVSPILNLLKPDPVNTERLISRAEDALARAEKAREKEPENPLYVGRCTILGWGLHMLRRLSPEAGQGPRKSALRTPVVIGDSGRYTPLPVG